MMRKSNSNIWLLLHMVAILLIVPMLTGCKKHNTPPAQHNINPVVKEKISVQSLILMDKYLIPDKATAIFIYADWCPHCQSFKPIVAELAVEMKDTIEINQLNYEDAKELAKSINLTGVPKMLVFDKNGRYIKSINGQLPKEKLKAELTL